MLAASVPGFDGTYLMREAAGNIIVPNRSNPPRTPQSPSLRRVVL
jgi:hypothetical protein